MTEYPFKSYGLWVRPGPAVIEDIRRRTMKVGDTVYGVNLARKGGVTKQVITRVHNHGYTTEGYGWVPMKHAWSTPEAAVAAAKAAKEQRLASLRRSIERLEKKEIFAP